MVKIVENITELVGNSPIIKLKNGPENGAEIYLKLEYFNPGGSVKDRIALQMIRQAEADGRLKKGGTIVEHLFSSKISLIKVLVYANAI